MADGKVIIDTDLNNKGFIKGIGTMKNETNGLTSAVKKLGVVIASVFAVRTIVRFGKECIDLGSSIAEVQNVVDVAFGDMAYKIESFADTSIENFGMSRLAAKKTASTYMAMARGMGMAEGQASDMAIALTGLTADVASFFNISQELADVKLKSVFTGETETLKDLGVVMTQTNLKAYALSKGITKDISAMGQAELVALRYQFVMDQLALTHGDFARTSDSWANQTRILSMQWQEFMSIMGQALITVLTPVVKMLNNIVSALISMANTFNSVVSSLFGGTNTQIQQTESNAAAVGGAIESSVEDQNALTDATKQTAKAQKKMLAGFDEVNKLSDGGAGAAHSNAAGGAGAAALPTLTTSTVETDAGKNEKMLDFFEKLQKAIQPSVDALGRLWEQLKLVGSFAGDALKDFYETFLKPLGTWALGKGFPRFVDAITNGLAKVDWQKINNALHDVWLALEPFAENVGEGLLWLWENVLVPFGTWTMNNVVPLFLEAIAAALTAFNAIWDAVKPGLEWLWENFLKPIAQWTGGVIVSVLTRIVDALKSFSTWCSENKGTIQDIAIVIGSFVAAWGIVKLATIIYGIVTSLVAFVTTGGAATMIAGGFAAAMAAINWPIVIITVAIGALIAIVVLLVKHWDEVKAAAVACWEKIKETWNSVSTWFNSTVVQPISKFFSTLWDNIKLWASNTWKAIKDTFVGAATWFTENVITPVTDGFKGFINGLIGMVESFVNFFIGGINDIIGAINSMIEAAANALSIVGIKVEAPQIPTIPEIAIPRLATGAVIPPNREFLAVLGDQKSGTNIEAPMSTIKQGVREVMAEMGIAGGTGEMTLVLDGDFAVLARGLHPYLLKEGRRIGVNLVKK